MRKIFRKISVIVVVAAFIMLLSNIGGIEHETMNFSEAIIRCLVDIVIALIALLIVAYTNND